MKLLDTTWNWSLSLITFTISLPKVLKRTIDLNTLEELYNVLSGFGITIVVEILKWKGQKPKSKYEFTILTKFFKHVLSLSICLRWLHEILSGPGAEELLHLAITMINSSLENLFQWYEGTDSNSSRTLLLTIWCWAVLKELCSACHRSCISRYG